MRGNYSKTNKIRILLAEDSLTVRKKLMEIIEREDDMQVVAEAVNGKQALYYAEMETPDVILMDVVMPVMDGPLAIKKIMSHFPAPIIVCSSAENRKKGYEIWDPLKSGALGKIEKTDAIGDPGKWEHDLVRMIRAAARVRVKVRNEKKRPADKRPVQTMAGKGVKDFNLVCFGLSTGGPGVIARICGSIPKGFPLPVLLVIHMSDKRHTTFHEWLADHCGLKVMMAKDGMDVKQFAGSVIVAPPEKHMIVSNGWIRLIKGHLVNYCRPSVDELFFSVAKDHSFKPIGVLLTGIGRDGADGLKAIKTSGGHTICQDEATSVIFGMPNAGIQNGAAMDVLPDYQIAGKIISLVADKNRSS